jgi:hypothetical protein
MCKVFTQYRLWERAEAGEFRIRIDSSPLNPPFTDRKGQKCVISDEVVIIDDAYPMGHHRHEVARAHRYITDTGVIGASGLVDPKDIMIEDTNYRGIKRKNPHCDLCESGDMIQPKDRFYDSKYNPSS